MSDRRSRFIDGRAAKIPIRRINDTLARSGRKTAYKVLAAAVATGLLLCVTGIFALSSLPGPAGRVEEAGRLDSPAEDNAAHASNDISPNDSKCEAVENDLGTAEPLSGGEIRESAGAVNGRSWRAAWRRRRLQRFPGLETASTGVPGANSGNASQTVAASPSQALTELALDRTAVHPAAPVQQPVYTISMTVRTAIFSMSVKSIPSAMA